MLKKMEREERERGSERRKRESTRGDDKGAMVRDSPLAYYFSV